jgi:hypothetical protein
LNNHETDTADSHRHCYLAHRQRRGQNRNDRRAHTSPSHSAFFGALGGYRGSDGVPPSGPTIDYELSKVLPETLLPHLCIGMDSMENMKAKPTVANLSASGAGQPIFMHSNPNHLYQMLYGGISDGNIRQQHEARSSMFDRIE